MDVHVITLEDGIDYIIFEAIEHNNKKYLFLANENDNDDICVRKVIEEEGKEYLIKLDDREEFEEVMNIYYQKNKGSVNNEE